MAGLTNPSINTFYTFNTNAVSALGALVTNAQLLGILNFASAQNKYNVSAQYAAIYPSLDPSIGAPQSPVNVTFYEFQAESGQKFIMADPWIDGSSVVVVTLLNFSINFSGVSATDKINILAVLGKMGVNFSVST